MANTSGSGLLGSIPPFSSSTPPPLGAMSGTTSIGAVAATPANTGPPIDVTKDIYPLVQQLTNPETRENALLDLSKRRETFADLAPILWYSFGTIAALLQEIISIYPMLSPPTLTPHASNRVCNALALLQCVASHNETKSKLMYAYIPLYLYPFLNTVSKLRPFEYLRLTSLGVIGALVKVDDPEVVQFLLQTEIIPLCLRIMETGTELSKTVATFIVQKILLDDSGLNYVCATPERFHAICTVLSSMIIKLLETPSSRLLKHIVRCYLRLSEHPKAREALKQRLPDALKDPNFGQNLRAEESVQKWLSLLMKNLSERPTSEPTGVTPTLNPQPMMNSSSGSGMTNRPPTGLTGSFTPVPSIPSGNPTNASRSGPWGM